MAMVGATATLATAGDTSSTNYGWNAPSWERGTDTLLSSQTLCRGVSDVESQTPEEEATEGAPLEEPQCAHRPRSGSTSDHGGNEDSSAVQSLGPTLAHLFGSDDSEPESDLDDTQIALAIAAVMALASSRPPGV